MKNDTQVAEIIEYYEERAARITAAKFDVSVEFVRSITQG